jgi:hypothetical protein
VDLVRKVAGRVFFRYLDIIQLLGRNPQKKCILNFPGRHLIGSQAMRVRHLKLMGFRLDFIIICSFS